MPEIEHLNLFSSPSSYFVAILFCPTCTTYILWLFIYALLIIGIGLLINSDYFSNNGYGWRNVMTLCFKVFFLNLIARYMQSLSQEMFNKQNKILPCLLAIDISAHNTTIETWVCNRGWSPPPGIWPVTQHTHEY